MQGWPFRLLGQSAAPDGAGPSWWICSIAQQRRICTISAPVCVGVLHPCRRVYGERTTDAGQLHSCLRWIHMHHIEMELDQQPRYGAGPELTPQQIAAAKREWDRLTALGRARENDPVAVAIDDLTEVVQTASRHERYEQEIARLDSLQDHDGLAAPVYRPGWTPNQYTFNDLRGWG